MWSRFSDSSPVSALAEDTRGPRPMGQGEEVPRCARDDRMRRFTSLLLTTLPPTPYFLFPTPYSGGGSVGGA